MCHGKRFRAERAFLFGTRGKNEENQSRQTVPLTRDTHERLHWFARRRDFWSGSAERKVLLLRLLPAAAADGIEQTFLCAT